jgi:hypothetical protein
MLLFKLILALVIVVAALVLVFRFHRQIQAGGSPKVGPGKKEEVTRSTELEEFIAAYRRDKGSGQAQPSAGPAQPAAVRSPAGGAVVATPAVKARAGFLTGPAKLGFLVLKAGLPDHHVFAHTRVSDLVEGSNPAALANLPIDLLVCNTDLAIVAAVDLNTGTQSDALLVREKEQRLRAAGIRYLHFEPGAFPKPAQIRELIYGSK